MGTKTLTMNDLAAMIAKGFGNLGARFDEADGQFKSLGKRFDRLEEDLKLIRSDLAEVKLRLGSVV